MIRIQINFKQKFAPHRNEKAFTLLEALFAFSIFAIIVFFMSPLLQIIMNDSDSSQRVQQMEWEVFCNQIKKEIRVCTSAAVINGRLVLTNNTDTIIYEKYGNTLRRRVNSTGNETLLQNVSSYSFVMVKNGVMITVTDLTGKNYRAVLYSLFNWSTA